MKNNKKYTIGVFLGSLDDAYQETVWEGIADEAELLDINLICFPGMQINTIIKYDYQANIVYKLADKENIDGLIILSNTMGTYLTHDKIINFCRQYMSIPIINFGFDLPGIKSIVVDSNEGMKQLITHLICDHKYKSFAFIKGPPDHREAEDRYKIFQETLNSFKLNINKDLIFNGNFLKESGEKTADLILKKKKKIDVIVSANDNMAIGILDVLQKNKIKVPGDIAIAGYDDINESCLTIPSLTTVHQPIYEKARESLLAIIDLIENKKIKNNKLISSRLVIRQSCGCLNIINEIDNNLNKKKFIYDHSEDLKIFIINEFEKSKPFLEYPLYTQKEQIEIWVTKYLKSIQKKNNDFIYYFEKLLIKTKALEIDVSFWHHIITCFRKFTLNYNLTNSEFLKAESIWEKSRILINTVFQKSERIQKIQSKKLSDQMWKIGNSISSAIEINSIIKELENALNILNIKYCFFSIYENNISSKNNHISEFSHLIFALINGIKMNINENGIRFKTKKLIPDKIFKNKNNIPLIIKPLYFQDEQLGFILFEKKASDKIIYDIMRQQISIALKGSFLMSEIKKHAENLEKEVANRTSDLTLINKKLHEEIQHRKSAEKALKLSQKNLKSITEATPVPLIIIRLSDGKIKYANYPFLSTFDVNENEIEDKNIYHFFVDNEIIQEILEKMNDQTHMTDLELLVNHKGGSIFSIISSFQALIFQGENCVIIGFYDISKRKQLEKEILEISDREQRRIGQDLHDDLCQNLAGIAIMISALENKIKGYDPVAAENAENITKLVNSSIGLTKNLARGLYPIMLENNGLVESIKELAGKIESRFKIHCDFIYDENIIIKDDSAALHLYRIIQEALNNAIKHAKAKYIIIKLFNSQNKTILSIKDDGLGFQIKKGIKKGMGLKIMEYRSNMISGKLEIESSKKSGTLIICTFQNKSMDTE